MIIYHRGVGFPTHRAWEKNILKTKKVFSFNIFSKFRILYPDPKRLIVVFGFKLCVATLGQ